MRAPSKKRKTEKRSRLHDMRPPSEPEACRLPGSRTAPPTSPSHAGSARSANNPVEEFGSSRRITGFPHTPRVRPDPVTKHGLDRPTPAKPEIIPQQSKLFRPSPQGQRCDAPRCKTTWKGSPTNPCQRFRPCQNLFRQGRFAIFETRWRSHRSFGCNTSANDYSSSRYMCST